MRNQVKELGKLLEKDQISLKEIGNLIDKGWYYKKKLSPLITNEKINNIYSESIKNGSYGGKILGAGGGGFLMLVSEPSKKKDIIKKVESMGFKHYDFGFEFKGTEVIEII